MDESPCHGGSVGAGKSLKVSVAQHGCGGAGREPLALWRVGACMWTCLVCCVCMVHAGLGVWCMCAWWWWSADVCDGMQAGLW